MPTWITRNLAPISFFALVFLAIIGINISNQASQSKADLLIYQATQIQTEIDKYDNYLLYKYGSKTDDYVSFANDVQILTSKLEASRDNLTSSPNDEEGNQLREDLRLLLNFKIDTYKKISFDLEPYISVLAESKTIGSFKKIILNTEKLEREKRIEELSKISQAGEKLNQFYIEKRQGEPNILEKVKYDTDLMTKAYESLKNNPEIEPTLLNEIKTNFGPDEEGNEQWPSENVPNYTLDQQILGLNDMQTALGYVKESLQTFQSKYRPERLQTQKQF